MDRHEAEPAVKWKGGEAGLFEEVAERPKAVDIRDAATVEQRLHDKSGGVRLVVQMKSIACRRVPFGVVERFSPRPPTRILSLLPQYSALGRGKLRHYVGIARGQGRIIRVVVRAHEVSGDILTLAKIEKLIDPVIVSGGRTADLYVGT